MRAGYLLDPATLLRFSIGPDNDEPDVERLVEALRQTLGR